ncbi:S-layer homology domain-containing protein [Thermincola ferriacetica]
MGKYKLKLRLIALWVAICFLLSNVITMSVINQAAAAEQTALYSAGEMAGKAVKFINHKYKSGERIDGYTAYVLTLAGEDLAGEKWTNNGKTLKSEIENLADQLGDSNSLISYIIATQNTDGSFGPYANEYGTKVPLQALAMVKNDLTVGTDVYGQVHEAITKAVNYYKNKYRNGSMAYNVNGWDFDYRCVEALVAAGEDISTGEWVYNGTSLKDVIITSANAAADNAADLDAVRLAKELIALNAVDPYSVHIDTLAAAIRSKASTVADQVYFGNNIYDHVTVLTALGKTGKLAGIDQAKALEYLNNFKHAHSNSWGSPAGTAWGGFSPEEADLTAQVITALSYFDGADTPDSPVYSAIQDGLTYLMDIQDADTAAIPSQWDNTFSTAETLIALKSLGKTYNDYAGNDSLWIKKSRTKTIAQCLLAVNMWKDSARRDRLANLLINRQRTEEPGKGSFDNSVYSDMWAYIALGEAGKINSGSFHTENAKAYILSKQSVEQDVYGSWGEKFGDTYYPDVLSTAQAIRALTYLPDAAVDAGIQAAVDRGVAYLKGLQQDDGGVYAPPWDDPAVDNAELVITLHKLGEDPESSEWTRNVDGKTVNPVSYLMTKTMNEDGSFGTSRNVFGAAEALYAYVLQSAAGTEVSGSNNNSANNNSSSSNSNSNSNPSVPSSPNEYSVSIAVVGKNGERLYGPGSVTVSKNGEWGLTALGALHVTGLSYTEDNGFVKSIAGQANSGVNGWMYSVNNSVPSVLACDKTVNEGDRIIWWYSTEMNSNGPSWDSLFKSSTTGQPQNTSFATQISGEVGTALDKLAEMLGLKGDTGELGPLSESAKAAVVVNKAQPTILAEIIALKKILAQNTVELIKKVEANQGTTVSDTLGEVGLTVPAKALDRNTEITVKEITIPGAGGINGAEAHTPTGYRPVSSVYQFGPDGTSFKVPATLVLKVAIPRLTKPENLALAWYDKVNGAWVAIPAVVDVANGLVVAKIRHFSDYAVFAKETKRSFADVTSTSYDWARHSIETLAGAGIVNGVDKVRFAPARPITRAELVSLLVKALALPKKTEDKAVFNDVPAGAWYAQDIAAAVRAGLIKGFGDGTCRPDRPVTREELAAILAQALNLQTSGKELHFNDQRDISSWAKTGVAAAAAHGLVKGFPNGAFRPAAPASRAECAVMIYRMLESV